jgi:predicted kinase
VRLRADVERKRLFGLAPEAASSGVPGGIYDEATSERVFAHLLDEARALLQAGQPVLVDATFIRRARRAPFIALAGQLGLPWRLLAFDAPEAVLRERVRRRAAQGGDASEADEAVLHSQLAHREPLTPDEAEHALAIDTRQPVDWSAWDSALPGN